MAPRGNRAIRQGHGRALDGKTRGTTQIEQDGAARTTGSSLGQGRAGTRAGTGSVAGIGTTGSGGASRRGWTSCATAASKVAREDSCAAKRRRDSARDMAEAQDRARKTAENKHDRTPRRKTRRRRTSHHKRERAQGPRQEQGFSIQRARKGRKWPTSPNLPSAALMQA